MILPIFCDVDPDDVKLKYLDALKEHEGKLGCDVLQWKETLTEVAHLGGLVVKGKGYGEIINDIIDKVQTKLMKRRMILPEHLVGIDPQVENIMAKLNEGSHNVPYLVIHGMGGIGKTTLARAVFNQISNQFEGCSFLSDIREYVQRGRIIDLQKQLLSEVLRGRSPEIHNSNDGIRTIRERLRGKKVLLVLDDVDKKDQLSKLARKSDWFGPRSKIIVTTRNINFLPIKEEDEGSSRNQVRSEEFDFYEMKEMDSSNALKLFSQHALGMDSPPHRREDISRKITKKTGGLPLALEVIGSSLFGKNEATWKATLTKLESMPNEEVFDRLMISYDMLDRSQKEIFLDIACYFIGEKKLHPYYMWEASNYVPEYDVLILTRMSLVKIDEDDKLWMHDQLRDLGREIIQREGEYFWNRSRLWEPETALDVVQRKKGTDKIVALRLTGLSREQNFTSEQFSKVPNLRFLELEGGNLEGDFENLLSDLSWLSWKNYPLELGATNLCLEKLVVLKLSDNDNIEDWAGWEPFLVSKNLKVIHIAGCPRLKKTPDFSKCDNLERLVIKGCESSLVVDGSLSILKDLKHLEITGASEWASEVPPNLSRSNEDLKFTGPSEGPPNLSRSYEDRLESIGIEDSVLFAVPSALGGLTSLLTLRIENMCDGELHPSFGEMMHLRYLSINFSLLKTLPDSIGKLKSLLELDLGSTVITDLPPSIGDLKMLTKLNLSRTQIEELPNSIGGLESLIELNLQGKYITELPACIGDLKGLEILSLSGSAIKELPKAIGKLGNLKTLDASLCRNLEGEIPSEIGGLCSLRTLNLQGSNISRLPTSMNQLSRLQQLELDWCDKLEPFPDLPTSLEELDFRSHLMGTAINLSRLTNLVKLKVIRTTSQIEWIKGLSTLESLHLHMEEDDAPIPPLDLVTLSRLRVPFISCVDLQLPIGLPSSLESLTLYRLKFSLVRSLFSNLTNLSSLSLSLCWVREAEFDDVIGQQLEKLVSLNLEYVKLPERLSVSGLSRSKGLKRLCVIGCSRLKEIHGVEKLKSLEELTVRSCRSLGRLGDLSELKDMRKILLSGCPLLNVPDLRLQPHVIVTSY